MINVNTNFVLSYRRVKVGPLGKDSIGFGHQGKAQMIDPGEYPKKETILSYTHIQSHRVQSDETHTKSHAVLIDLSLLYKATCLRFIGSYKNGVNHCSKGEFLVIGNFHYENSVKSPQSHFR